MRNAAKILGAICAGLFWSSAAIAQNTSTVYNPEVDLDDRGVEWRGTWSNGEDGDESAFAQRVHFQSPIGGSLRWRLIGQLRKPDGQDWEADFVRGELLWQLTPDDRRWASGLRFEAAARNGGRPDEIGVHWANQIMLGSDTRLRAHAYLGRQFGDAGLDGLRVTSRASLMHNFGPFKAGVEHFAAYGSTGDWFDVDDQTHEAGPVASFSVGKSTALQVGWLVGLTAASDEHQLRLLATQSF